MKVCRIPGCPTLIPADAYKGLCPEHRKQRDRDRGSATARGYGGEHRRTRATLLAAAIGTPCHFCGEPMLEGQPLALDHTEDRTGYRGITHLACNASDGGRRRHN